MKVLSVMCKYPHETATFLNEKRNDEVFCLIKYHFFRFPKNESQRQKWDAWVNKVHVVGTFKSTPNSGLCSAHFAKECYTPRNRLFQSAVPSIAPE